MTLAATGMDEVRRKFSHDGAARQWNDLYSTKTPRLDELNFRERRDITVAEVISLVTAKSCVLDLGCGTGPVIGELRKHGINSVGMDYSADMLDYAAARLRSMGLDDSGLQQGDCRHLPYPDANFDVVVCLGVISYIQDIEPALREIRRVLKPGGTLLLSFRNKFNPLFSDPVKLGKFAYRKLLGRGPNVEQFEIGHFLDYRNVTDKLDALDFRLAKHFGIGYGPYSVAGRPLFNDEQSKQISRYVTRFLAWISAPKLSPWLADVSLWVYRKPAAPAA